MTTILAFLFVLGVLIFVHELGHFLAARRLGVRVLTFSLGFGPKILKVQRGDTEYCVSAIPLGGYVKMAGESPEDPRSGQPDEFLSKTKWERFQVLIMGPVMNIILAVVVLAVVLAQDGRIYSYLDQNVTLGAVVPGTAAEKAELRAGDRVVAVDGKTVASWRAFAKEIAPKLNNAIALTVQRDGQTVQKTLHAPAQASDIADIGLLPDEDPTVASIEPGDPADRAGVKPGDVLLTLNGQRIVLASRLRQLVSDKFDQKVTLNLRRDGQPMTVDVPTVKRGDRAFIGLTPENRTTPVERGALEALQLSVQENYENTGLIFKTLGGLFTGATSVKQLQGPVGIAVLSGESVKYGWISLLSLMAMLSLNLGILNLMPVPVLDGGHILIMALEGISRRDFSMQVKERMLLAGFVVLMMLMVTVIYNDLTRISWIERLMPWRN